MAAALVLISSASAQEIRDFHWDRGWKHLDGTPYVVPHSPTPTSTGAAPATTATSLPTPESVRTLRPRFHYQGLWPGSVIRESGRHWR